MGLDNEAVRLGYIANQSVGAGRCAMDHDGVRGAVIVERVLDEAGELKVASTTENDTLYQSRVWS